MTVKGLRAALSLYADDARVSVTSTELDDSPYEIARIEDNGTSVFIVLEND